MAALLLPSISISPKKPQKTLKFSKGKPSPFIPFLLFGDITKFQSLPPLLSLSNRISSSRLRSVPSTDLSSFPSRTRDYEFYDTDTEVEVRLDLKEINIQSHNDIFVDTDDSSLLIRAKSSGRLVTLMEVSRLFDKIKPAETIWFLDEDQLVINLKKYDIELKWPDVMESWESLTAGVTQLLKGTSIYIIGDTTVINQKVATELAVGLGYTPLSTSELLENYSQRSIDSWVVSEGVDSVAEAEGTVLESLSSHIRTVVATLGGQHGAASRHDKWQHLHAGFTVWLSKSEASDEASAKEEAQRHIQAGNQAYSNADVIVKLGGWDSEHSKVVAQACLSALKQLILSDKQLTGKKSLYIRLGCRGDWPNIKPPGWDPSNEADSRS